jgi:hypothetical protein
MDKARIPVGTIVFANAVVVVAEAVIATVAVAITAVIRIITAITNEDAIMMTTELLAGGCHLTTMQLVDDTIMTNAMTMIVVTMIMLMIEGITVATTMVVIIVKIIVTINETIIITIDEPTLTERKIRLSTDKTNQVIYTRK